MDLASVIGLVLGLVAIVGGNWLEGGHLGSISQPTAALIVFGGTFGATMLTYPMHALVGAGKSLQKAFKNSPINLQETVQNLVRFAHKARKDGIVSLEKVADSETDPFLKKALTLAVDGTEPKIIREAMELELDNYAEEEEVYGKVFESAGGYSPTIGILGAVLGLIHVMQNLTDPGKLGGGIAVAFVATVYGVGTANLIFLPLAGKLKAKLKAELKVKEVILEGILSIQHGENPRLIEQKLVGFLSQDEKATYVSVFDKQNQQAAAA